MDVREATSEGGTGGVVVHLDEGDDMKHEAVVRNVKNLLDDFDGALEVELVTHGAGVGLCLPESRVANEVQELIARGVTVTACENTLRGRGLDRSTLAEGVITVPAGIGELVRKQQAGWAYVRP